MRRTLFIQLAFWLAASYLAIGVAAATDAVEADADRAALDATTAAACDKSIVLLGEATHGDGHADAFKVALAKRLMSRCGFNAVLFEASFYEFVAVARDARAARTVSPARIGTAVGALWKFDPEVQPLFDFLANSVNAGRVEVGGLDFQAGGFQQPYSNESMMTELASRLPADRRPFCNSLYASRIGGDDPPNGLTPAQRDQALAACFKDIETRLYAAPHSTDLEVVDQQAELDNLQMWLAHSAGGQAELLRARDEAMARNVYRFIARARHLPAKVIVWTANGHAARDTAALADYAGQDNLGAALARRFGTNLFALGITACGGEYRWSFGSNRPLPPPPTDSLEAHWCTAHPSTSSFAGAADLAAFGVSDSGLLRGHAFGKADWHTAFDGVVILDREFPAHGELSK